MEQSLVYIMMSWRQKNWKFSCQAAVCNNKVHAWKVDSWWHFVLSQWPFILFIFFLKLKTMVSGLNVLVSKWVKARWRCHTKGSYSHQEAVTHSRRLDHPTAKQIMPQYYPVNPESGGCRLKLPVEQWLLCALHCVLLIIIACVCRAQWALQQD